MWHTHMCKFLLPRTASCDWPVTETHEVIHQNHYTVYNYVKCDFRLKVSLAIRYLLLMSDLWPGVNVTTTVVGSWLCLTNRWAWKTTSSSSSSNDVAVLLVVLLYSYAIVSQLIFVILVGKDCLYVVLHVALCDL